MSDIAFAFEIGGRNVRPDDPEQPEIGAMLQEIVEAIVDRTGDLVCPQHREAPRFLCRGDDVASLSVEVHGCCDAMVAQVKERMGA